MVQSDAPRIAKISPLGVLGYIIVTNLALEFSLTISASCVRGEHGCVRIGVPPGKQDITSEVFRCKNLLNAAVSLPHNSDTFCFKGALKG